MRITVLFFYLFLFIFTMGFAQTDSTRVFKTHALQFRSSGLLSLSSFKGSFISYKYHPKDDHAFRFGISLNGDKSKENQKRDNYRNADTSFLDLDRNYNEFFIECTVEYLKYFNLENELKMFFGIGPRLYIRTYNYNADKIRSKDYYYQKEYRNDQYKAGFTFSYGLEWLFKDNMSLHAEYGINVSYIYEKYNNTQIYPYDDGPDGFVKDSNESNGFEIDDTGGLLGLSLYF
jgi:hypothetical protein